MNLLVTNPTNIRYLTGFTGEGWLVVAGTKKYLLPNPLYLEEAKTLPGVTVISSLNQFTSLEFEEDHLTVAQYNKLKKKLTPAKGKKIEAMREIKRPDELVNIRLAATMTKQCFRLIERRLRPGMTESRIALEIEGFFKYRGADIAFPPIVAFNEHSSQPHYSGRGNNPLRRGSLVLLDFGAKVNGYCADMTRVVFVGPAKPEWKQAFDAVSTAQQTVFSLLRSGERDGAVLDRTAKKLIKDAGFPPYEHSLGHNIGLDVHEAPRLTIKKPATLKPGMVFTVEPATYTQGRYGIRIEDLVLLTKRGIEVLT